MLQKFNKWLNKYTMVLIAFFSYTFVQPTDDMIKPEPMKRFSQRLKCNGVGGSKHNNKKRLKRKK